MLKQGWLVLVVLALAFLMVLPAPAAEKTDKDAIMQELAAAIDKNPEILRSVIFSIADNYQRDNKIDQAIALYEKALAILENKEDILSRLAGLYNQKADYAKSAEVYKKLTELKPDNTWYFNMLSDAYINAKQNDKAAELWVELLKKSANPEIFMQGANFYSRENDMEKAILAAKKAVELKPDNVGYQQNLESYYMRAEKFSDAEAICAKILSSSKDQWTKDWANSELIGIYQKQNKLADLIAKFEKDLVAAPKDASQYKKLADLYQRTNERDKSVEVYEKAVTAGITDRDVNQRLLDLYENTAKYDKAEAQIKKIMADNPQETSLYERLASILKRAGKDKEAKQAWQDLLAKAPNDANVISRYADVLNVWNDPAGAIEQYRKAQALDSKNLWHTMRIADIMIGQGKTDDAKKELNSVLAKATDDWMKKQIERKLESITARAEVSVPPAVPEMPAKASTPAAKPQTPAKVLAPVSEAPAKAPAAPKPAEKKKGIFGR